MRRYPPSGNDEPEMLNAWLEWFQRTLAGQDAPPLYYSDADPEADFDNVAGADADLLRQRIDGAVGE